MDSEKKKRLAELRDRMKAYGYSDGVEGLESIFPELRESKDERIRREILETLHYGLACEESVLMPGATTTLKEAIAYLERQKEQKSLNISAASEWLREHVCRYINSEYNEFHHCVEYDGSIDKERLINDFEEAMQQEEQKAIGDVVKNVTKDKEAATKFLKSAGIMDNNGELAEMYRSEQKPEEKLSKEEYVKKFKALCDAYEIKLPNREYDIYGLCGDLHKLFGDIRKPAEWSEDIIRKAIEEVGLTQHQINWFKNNVFPPKQEWSEEDKKNFGEAISYIKDDSLRDFLKSLPQRFNLRPKPEWNEEDNRRFRQVIDALDRNGYPLLAGWLESLPGRLTLQPIWKPSKEQMEALKDAFRKDGGNEYRKVINSLYRDLEKLL